MKIHIILIMGGLGNQMFQYAFYRQLASKNRFVYITYHPNIHNTHTGYELKRLFHLNPPKISHIFHQFLFSGNRIIRRLRHMLSRIIPLHYHHTDFGVYDPHISAKLGIHIYESYWQSELYFNDIKEKIHKDFTFPAISEEENLCLLEKIKNRVCISFHVRRGDYLNTDFAFTDGQIKNYFQNAAAYLQPYAPNPLFVIFSNDIPWCRKHILPPPPLENKSDSQENIIFVDWNTGENSFRDMQLMSLCHHHIIANSTFSWWGAWLNRHKDKIVIAPEIWFPGCPKEQYKDLIPKEWIKMKMPDFKA